MRKEKGMMAEERMMAGVLLWEWEDDWRMQGQKIDNYAELEDRSTTQSTRRKREGNARKEMNALKLLLSY